MQEEKIMDRIQKLLDKAMSTEFEPEQQALLQKADALMMQYSIDQVQLQHRAATDPGIKSQTPQKRTFKVYATRAEDADTEWEIQAALSQLFQNLARHYHVRLMPRPHDLPLGSLQVIGFPADMDFLEMMFIQLQMHLLTNLAPKASSDTPWVEVVANFKNTGHKWQEIHSKLQSHPDYPRRGEPWSKSAGLTMYAQYKKFVEKVGEEYVGTSSPKTWRSDFIAGYTTRIAGRLREMRAQTVGEDDRLPALFKDKDQQVEEALWILHPELKPHDPACKCDDCERARKPIRMSGPGSRGGSSGFRHRNTGAMNAGGKIANRADLAPSSGRVSSARKGELR